MSTSKKHFRWYADIDTSICVCPCGDRITFPDGNYARWMAVHGAHVETEATETFVTNDGARCLTSDSPRHYWSKS